MKKLHKSIAYLVIMVFALQFLSSCGSVGITKMRYNRGYNLDIFTSKKKQEKEDAAMFAMRDSINKKNAARLAGYKKVQPAEAVLPVAGVRPEATVTASEPASALTATAAADVAPAKESKPVKVSSVRKAIKSELKKAGVSYSELKQSAKQSSEKGGSETDIIILVILSLFPILSLIAVYLHDDGVTTNFWVTLLLHFLFLYWLFALLVVLDVIDLA